MGNRRLNNWRWWLQTFSVGLLIFAAFAPLSEPLDSILTLVAVGGMLVHLCVDSPASRRLFLSSLIPLAVFLLLASLFSFGRSWVFFGILGVWAGVWLWGVFKREHAEYLAEHKRHP